MNNTTVVIDNELNDDWMKKLPGYKDEEQIIIDSAKYYNYNTKGKLKTLKLKVKSKAQ